MKILALILARGGSKRCPGKNKRLLGGKPLIVWSIDAAKGVTEIQEIMISTDDSAIADVARTTGVLVPWLRPPELATDTADTIDVAIHALDWYESERGVVDALLLLQPTSPFRTTETIRRGIELFTNYDVDSVVGVTPTHAHPAWTFTINNNRLVPYNKKALEKVESLLKVKAPRLITVSRFDKRKNHEKVIMTLKNLKQKYPDIVYICIGYGDEEENLKKLVQELNLSAQVMFFKDISNDLKNALIAKSNIFVMPSIIHKTSVEGFGIAYVEAAQYGVPSLGGRDGGASDAISHDKTGLICDGNSLDEIYSSLNSMIENKTYLELGRNAKELSSNFNWSNIIEKYKKILN